MPFAQLRGREREIGYLQQRAANEQGQTEEQSRLQRVFIVEFYPAPKIVGDEDTLRPDHISDDVHTARKTYRRYDTGNRDAEIQKDTALQRDEFGKALLTGYGGIADAEVRAERINDTVALYDERVIDDDENERNKEDKGQKVDLDDLAEIAFENIPKELPAVGRQRAPCVFFTSFLSFEKAGDEPLLLLCH